MLRFLSVAVMVCGMLLLGACGEERVTTTHDRPDGISVILGIRFQEADVNKDGRLSYVEYLSLPIARRGNRDEIFEAIDYNADEHISKPEAQRYARSQVSPVTNYLFTNFYFDALLERIIKFGNHIHIRTDVFLVVHLCLFLRPVMKRGYFSDHRL